MKTARWKEIGILYTIGTILVIFGHAHMSDWSLYGDSLYIRLVEYVYLFHMPLFFFIAGFLYENSDSLMGKGYFSWVKGKIISLMVPYVIISLLSAFPKYYFENHTFKGLASYLVHAVFFPRPGVWEHLWLLPVLCLTYIFVGLFGKRCFVLIGILAVSAYYSPFTTDFLGFEDFKRLFIYFWVGAVFRRYIKPQKEPLPPFLKFVWICSGTFGTWRLSLMHMEHKAIELLTGLIMISVCWELSTLVADNAFCRWINRYCLAIYVYSWPFMAVTMTLLWRLGLNLWMISICMFLVGLLGPFGLIHLYERCKKVQNSFLELLLGIKERG